MSRRCATFSSPGSCCRAPPTEASPSGTWTRRGKRLVLSRRRGERAMQSQNHHPLLAGAAVAGQRLVPEVRAAVLLEHQADVGHQNHGPQTGSALTPVTALPPDLLPLMLPLSHLRPCSTTAGSAGRPSAGSAAPNAPRIQSWASSSQCGSATTASVPSKRKSE